MTIQSFSFRKYLKQISTDWVFSYSSNWSKSSFKIWIVVHFAEDWSISETSLINRFFHCLNNSGFALKILLKAFEVLNLTVSSSDWYQRKRSSILSVLPRTTSTTSRVLPKEFGWPPLSDCSKLITKKSESFRTWETKQKWIWC